MYIRENVKRILAAFYFLRAFILQFDEGMGDFLSVLQDICVPSVCFNV